jgi:hypothetical protein
VKNLPEGYLGCCEAEMLELLSAHPTLKAYFNGSNLPCGEAADSVRSNLGERVAFAVL